MIHSITCNRREFRTINFLPGFNMVISDTTERSTAKDSRNGTGKTTLIEIFHFCLGSNPRGLLRSEALAGWIFSLELDINGKVYNVSRGVSDPTTITVEGDVSALGIGTGGSRAQITVIEWLRILGRMMFSLDENTKYAPTARSLLSYFIRRMSDWKGSSYVSPFENYPKQLEWDKQVNNAYLLGLNWLDASSWQILRDREKVIQQLQAEAQAGTLPFLGGKIGDLETSKVLTANKITSLREQIKSFKVHPQYQSIQEEANRLTQEIHELVNESFNQRSILSIYEQSIAQEAAPETDAIQKLYKAAGVELPSAVTKQISDVINFHNEVVHNRRQFLQDEIQRVRGRIRSLENKIEERTTNRAERLGVLRTHGALEEYSALQSSLNSLEAQYAELEVKIASVKQLDAGKTSLKIDIAVLEQKAKRSYDELSAIRNRAIELFNANSEALYSAPGKLIITISPTGFKFDIKIQRLGSTGIGNMNTLCYDLVIAELWSKRRVSPGFLVHDSTIFDGVDVRQTAHALELAAKRSIENGFQYICMMNSDAIPIANFSPKFSIEPYVRIRLRDDTPDGGLLGIRI